MRVPQTSKPFYITSEGYCVYHTEEGYIGACQGPWSIEQCREHFTDHEDPKRAAETLAAIESHHRGELLELTVPEGLRRIWLLGGTLPEGLVIPKNTIVIGI